MNRATEDVVQDAQKQMQGQPTAAQQSPGAEPSAKMADQGLLIERVRCGAEADDFPVSSKQVLLVPLC